MGGRIMQFDLAGGAPRMIAEDVPMANAFEFGPDGKLYFPVMGANQIWRVDLARGSPEVGAGRILCLRQGSPVETVAEGFGRPEGLCLSEGKLIVVDVEKKAALAANPDSAKVEALAENLPVGAPAGVKPKLLGPIGNMTGPMIPSTGIAAGEDGTLYVASDAEGSVPVLRKVR